MNMKKLLKSLLAIAAAFLMVFSLGTAVNADENGTGSTNTGSTNSVEIIIKDDNNTGDSTYYAYQLMTVTNDSEEHYNYTINNKYRSILETVAGTISDPQTMKYIESLKSDDEKLRNFADKVYEKILESKIESDGNSGKNQKTLQVDPGYYLIAETGATGANNTDSLVMVDTAGSNGDKLEISTKEDVPTVEKKVQEINDSDHSKDSGWQDAADYDVNDEICYRLKGTLPNNYSSYTSYKYTFTDTLSKGLNEPYDVEIYIVDDKTSVDDSVETSDTLNGDNYHKITSHFYNECSDYNIQKSDKNYNSDYAGGKVLTLTCSNLKEIKKDDNDKPVNITSNSAIIVLYKTKLNENAEIGEKGNPNEVTLTYTNNPYNAGEGDTNTTPKDKVTVFTYKIQPTKYAKSVDGNKLPGAKFKLYKLDDKLKTDTYTVDSTTYHQVGDELMTDHNGNVEWDRIDAGTYILHETEAPAGYKVAEDVKFTVSAVYTTEDENPSLKTLSIDNNSDVIADINSGAITMNVIDSTSSKLPSTGGIGTTIFYVCGGSLVAVAAALLIAKKRASAE